MKKVTLNQISKISTQHHFYWASIIIDNKKFAESATKYGISDAVSESSSECDFWYGGRVSSDWEFYGEDLKNYLKNKGVNVQYFDSNSHYYNSEYLQQLKMDLTHSICNSESNTRASKLFECLELAIDTLLDESGCDYYCFTRTEKSGVKTQVENFYESDGLILGFTKNNLVSSDNCYENPVIKFYNLIDARWSPDIVNKSEIFDNLLEFSEVFNDIQENDSKIQEIKKQYSLEKTC